MASAVSEVPRPRSPVAALNQAVKTLPTRANFLAASVTEVICSICHLQLNEPVSLPCDHTFCRECITIWLTTQGRNTCPLDRGVLFALDDSDDPDLSLPPRRGDRPRMFSEQGADEFFGVVPFVASGGLRLSWLDDESTARETASPPPSERESLPSLELGERDEDASEFPEMAEDFFARPFVTGSDGEDDGIEHDDPITPTGPPVARSAAVRTSRAHNQNRPDSSPSHAGNLPATTTRTTRSAVVRTSRAPRQTPPSSPPRQYRSTPAPTTQANSRSTPQASTNPRPTRPRPLSATDIHLLAVATHQLNLMGMRSIRDIPSYPHNFTITDISEDIRDCVDMIMDMDASAVPVRLQTLKGFMLVIEGGVRLASRIAMDAVLGDELECACEEHEEQAQMAFYTVVGILGERVVEWIRTFGEE